MSIPRVVLDTNILVSALLSRRGNPAKILDMFLAGALLLVYNTEVYAEYEDVLYRPRLGIPQNDADIVMSAIRKYGVKVFVIPSVNPMPDEDDRAFYDSAKSADAYLVTGNIKHYPDEPFILSPAAFLELL